MFRHQCFTPGIKVVYEQHAVVTEGLAGEHLPQGDQVTVGHLLPLVHQAHALGVDQPVEN